CRYAPELTSSFLAHSLITCSRTTANSENTLFTTPTPAQSCGRISKIRRTLAVCSPAGRMNKRNTTLRHGCMKALQERKVNCQLLAITRPKKGTAKIAATKPEISPNDTTIHRSNTQDASFKS